MLFHRTYRQIFPHTGPDPLIRAIAATHGVPNDRQSQTVIRQIVDEVSDGLLLFDDLRCVGYMVFEIDDWAAQIEFAAVDTHVMTDDAAAKFIEQAIFLAETSTSLNKIGFSASPLVKDAVTQRHLASSGFIAEESIVGSNESSVQLMTLPGTRMGLYVG